MSEVTNVTQQPASSTKPNVVVVKKGLALLQTSTGSAWQSFLIWADDEIVGVIEDEGQIVSQTLTGFVQNVEAGQSWGDAFTNAKAQFVTAEVTEAQAVALATMQELANLFGGVQQFLDKFGLTLG